MATDERQTVLEQEWQELERAALEREAALGRERKWDELPHLLSLLLVQQTLLFACEVVRSVSKPLNSPVMAKAEEIACKCEDAIHSDVAKFATLACYSAALSVAHAPGPAWCELWDGDDLDGETTFVCPGEGASDRAITNALSCLARAAGLDVAAAEEIIEDVTNIDRLGICLGCWNHAETLTGYRVTSIRCETWKIAYDVKWGGICDLIEAAHRNGRPFPEGWKTTSAMSIARQIFAERDFALMPILGDALEDAGCADDDLLDHLRNDRGLWGRSDWALYNLVCRGVS